MEFIPRHLASFGIYNKDIFICGVTYLKHIFETIHKITLKKITQDFCNYRYIDRKMGTSTWCKKGQFDQLRMKSEIDPHWLLAATLSKSINRYEQLTKLLKRTFITIDTCEQAEIYIYIDIIGLTFFSEMKRLYHIQRTNK